MYFFASIWLTSLKAVSTWWKHSPLLKSARQTKSVEVIDHLIFYINRGVSVSGAMQLTGSFSPLFVNLVRSGETSGTLPLALKDLSDFYKTMLGLRPKIMNAVLYPIIISIAAVGAIVVYMLLCCHLGRALRHGRCSAACSHTHCHGHCRFYKELLDLAHCGHHWWYCPIRFLVTNVIPVKRVYERIKFAIPVVTRLP